jgi:hypothetical protein
MNKDGQEWGLPELVDACQVASLEGAHSVLNNVRPGCAAGWANAHNTTI